MIKKWSQDSQMSRKKHGNIQRLSQVFNVVIVMVEKHQDEPFGLGEHHQYNII